MTKMPNITETIGENEVKLNYENNRNKINVENETTRWCEAYRTKMFNYMKAVPHIPPTPFEMKLRHQDIKSGILKQYRKEVENAPHSRQLIARLDNKIDLTYQELLMQNTQEYGKCQVGFVVGWKCNVNKPHPEVTKIDDRF